MLEHSRIEGLVRACTSQRNNNKIRNTRPAKSNESTSPMRKLSRSHCVVYLFYCHLALVLVSFLAQECHAHFGSYHKRHILLTWVYFQMENMQFNDSAMAIAAKMTMLSLSAPILEIVHNKLLTILISEYSSSEPLDWDSLHLTSPHDLWTPFWFAAKKIHLHTRWDIICKKGFQIQIFGSVCGGTIFALILFIHHFECRTCSHFRSACRTCWLLKPLNE